MEDKLEQVNNADSAFIFLVNLLINQCCRTGLIIQVVQVDHVVHVVQVDQMVQVVHVVQVVKAAQVVSLDDIHSESLWFTWSKPTDYSEKLRCHACDGQA